MKSYLIETHDEKYEVSDGQMFSSNPSFLTTDYQTTKIKKIFDKYADILFDIMTNKTRKKLKKCSLRWLGVESNKIEFGYSLLFTDMKKELGKFYVKDTENLLKELEDFL